MKTHVVALGGACLVHHQDAGRDAGAVEQAGGQADDRLEPAVLDEVAARLALLAAAEQHAVGHDGGHPAVGLEHRQHVLDEHQVGLLALLRHPDGEAAGVLDVLLDVVLAEGRIGEDAVEALELAVVVLVLRAADGVFLPDVGVGDAVQQHVHLADGPGGADLLLAGERQVARVAARLADVVAGLDQHAARADGGVVDAHARLGLDDLDHGAHHVGRGVELARLLARRVGEVLDQVFVGGAEQVGELEVLVLEGDLLEVLDEVGQGVVVEGALADLAVEVDVLEHVLQGVDVGVLERLQRLVERRADVGLEVAELVPARLLRHEEGVLVRVLELLRDEPLGHALGLEVRLELLALLVEEVREPSSGRACRRCTPCTPRHPCCRAGRRRRAAAGWRAGRG